MLPVSGFAPIFRRILPSVAVLSALTYNMGSVMSQSTIPKGAQGPPTVVKSADEWRKQLSPQEYHVTREKGTERPWSSDYNHLDKREKGSFKCVCCGSTLFTTSQKFDSGSGWPSFTAPASEDAVSVHTDVSHGMVRAEVVCSKCGAHLGHVFNDGPRESTGLRYCINGVSLKFDKLSNS